MATTCSSPAEGRLLGTAVSVVTAAMAERTADRCEGERDRIEHALPGAWELHFALERRREHHHLQRVRQAVLADLPITSEAEERLEERLRVERRAEADQRGDLVIAGVPPDVRRARRDDGDLARLVEAPLAGDTEHRGCAADLEALLLVGMHVLR